jgi:hypothetical protein
MLTQHIALVPEAGGVNASELARVSAALQKQVTRDLTPIWGISATVDAFPHLEDVPAGYWPVILTLRDLGNKAGVHVDRNGLPFGLVELSPSWSLTASHQCLEMLIDPFGNRTMAGTSPRPDQGGVEFLLGICDPCEHARYAYSINEVLVSDFFTPAFLEARSTSDRYSFTGALQAPHEVLPGGHLAWYDLATNTWWMRSHFGDELCESNLGFIDRGKGTVREVLSVWAPQHLQSTKMTLEAFESRMGIPRQRALHASQLRAYWLRSSLPDTREPKAAPRLEDDIETELNVVGRSNLPGPQVLTALLRATLGQSGHAAKFAAAGGAATAASGRGPEAPVNHRSQLEEEIQAAVQMLEEDSPKESKAPEPPPSDGPPRAEPTAAGTGRTVPPPLPPEVRLPDPPPSSITLPPTSVVSGARTRPPAAGRDRSVLIGALSAVAGLTLALLFRGITAPQASPVVPAAPAAMAPPTAPTLAPAPVPSAAQASAPKTEPAPNTAPSAAPASREGTPVPIRHSAAPARPAAPVIAASNARAGADTPVPAPAAQARGADSLDDSLVNDRR